MKPNHDKDAEPHIEIFVDSYLVPESRVKIAPGDGGASGQQKDGTVYDFSCETTAFAPQKREGHEKTEAVVAGDQNMVVILGRSVNKTEGWKSRPHGWFALV